MTLHSPVAFILAIALVFPLGEGIAQERDGDSPWRVEPFALEGRHEQLVLVDLDGDERVDLVTVRPGRVEAHLSRPGRDFGAGEPIVLGVGGSSFGWDLADLEGDGARWLVAIVDGREARAWPFLREKRAFGEPRVLLERLTLPLPRGVQHVPFVRRVDGDTLADLVLPGTDAFDVRIQEADGSFRAPFRVAAEASLRTSLELSDALDASIGQSVRIPAIELRDVDGDGTRDLLSLTRDALQIFRGVPGGRLEDSPGVSLDLASRREQLETVDPEDIDFSNLTALLARTVQVLVEDIDGDGADDVLLREAGKVTYFGEGVDWSETRALQVLKASGNIVFAALHDEDEDGRRDLWLVRLEAISLADVFLWLIASGSVKVEIFVYRFEADATRGGRFARRPSRRIEITVRFPSLPDLIEESKAATGTTKDRSPMATLRARGGGGEEAPARDVVSVESALSGGELRLWYGRAAGLEKNALLELFGYRRDRDEYEIDLRNMSDLIALASDSIRREIGGATPDVQVALPGVSSRPGLFLGDLDGDGIDDLLILSERSEEGVRGHVLRSRREN